MARRSSKHRVTRRHVLAVLAAALVGATGVVTASSASSASSAQADQLRAIESTRLRALVDADTATARKLTAPDFQLINPAGVALSRDEFLGGVEAGVIGFLSLEPVSPITVRLSGDSATLRYPTAFDVVAGGTHVTHDGWTTALYERRDGRWQIVWAQSTAIPNDLDLFIESVKPIS